MKRSQSFFPFLNHNFLNHFVEWLRQKPDLKATITLIFTAGCCWCRVFSFDVCVDTKKSVNKNFLILYAASKSFGSEHKHFSLLEFGRTSILLSSTPSCGTNTNLIQLYEVGGTWKQNYWKQDQSWSCCICLIKRKNNPECYCIEVSKKTVSSTNNLKKKQTEE